MKVYRSLEELPEIQRPIVTQGTFDGVHKAHQSILNRVKSIANEKGGETVLVTYDPHPRMVLFPEDHGLKILSTLEEKISLLEAQGIDHLIVLPFTKEFSRMTSLEFIRDVLVNSIGTYCLVIGYNHRFGKNREGSFDQLKQLAELYAFELVEIPEQDVDHVAVSSTRIREALLNGAIQKANKYLGRAYFINANVIHGMQLGRTIGFPTANLEPNDVNKLIPADGVYAVNVLVHGKKYGGMMNIGSNPTIPGKGPSREVHLFDFDEDIYNQTIQVQFMDKLRNELKFSGVEALKTQLFEDKLHALQVLSRQHGITS